MRRSGVRIPLAPPQADIRSRMSVFCMPGRVVAVLVAVLLWRRWCSGRSGVLLCGAWPLGVPVGSGLPAYVACGLTGVSGRRRARPPARSPHASPKARSGRSRSPPVPSGPSGALHTSGACGGLKDKTCWFCGDFTAFWCGKIGIEVGGSQLEGWTKRVGFVATFWLAGAGKSTLKVVV